MGFSLTLGKMKLGVVAIATGLALTTSVMATNVAWAQETTEPAESFVTIREEVHQAGLEAAAAVLGMTPDEVADQLWGGTTLAELAEAQGVSVGDVRAAVEDAMSRVRQERVQELIATLVENGRITQARADWILEGMENGWFGLRRFMGTFDGLGRDRFGLARR